MVNFSRVIKFKNLEMDAADVFYIWKGAVRINFKTKVFAWTAWNGLAFHRTITTYISVAIFCLFYSYTLMT